MTRACQQKSEVWQQANPVNVQGWQGDSMGSGKAGYRGHPPLLSVHGEEHAGCTLL